MEHGSPGDGTHCGSQRGSQQISAGLFYHGETQDSLPRFKGDLPHFGTAASTRIPAGARDTLLRNLGTVPPHREKGSHPPNSLSKFSGSSRSGKKAPQIRGVFLPTIAATNPEGHPNRKVTRTGPRLHSAANRFLHATSSLPTHKRSKACDSGDF